MANQNLSALYYPYPLPKNIDNLKKALLVFDNIYFISPTRTGSNPIDSLTDVPNEVLDQVPINNENSYVSSNMPNMPNIYSETEDRSLNDPFSLSQIVDRSLNDPFSLGIFREFNPVDTDREFLKQSIIEDKGDENFRNIANRPGWEWEIAVSKSPDFPNLDPILVEYKDKSMIRVPFDVGESIMISHTLFACLTLEKKGLYIYPITDERIHRNLFNNRLYRGVKIANSKKKFAMPKISDSIRLVMP
jgi:hypothetical protein